MAALEIISLDTATPQLRAPASGDTYVANRAIAISPQAGSTALTLTGGTQTTSWPVIDATQTWNAGAVTFTGIKFNVVSDTSAAGSLLMDLQVGGSSKFSVTKAGSATFASSVTTPGSVYIWSSAQGFTPLSAAEFQVNSNGTTLCHFDGGGSVITNFGPKGIGFSASYNYGSVDLRLVRDAGPPIALAQRNGTSAQTFNIYNTYTDASNYERISFGWSANLFTIGREWAGTGSARNIRVVGGTGVLGIGEAPSAAVSWTFNSNNFLAGSDNAYDIGASGANRPRNLYMASWIRMATTTVASLPAAATAGAGARMFVTDASAPVFGSAVAGGGAVTVPVYSTGSAWNVG